MSIASEVTGGGWKEVCEAGLVSLDHLDLPDDFEVPSLSESLTEFLQESKDPDQDVRRLGQIIECDPGLTVRLLKFVNSAVHGNAAPVHSPTEALIRLGVRTTRNYLMAAGLRGATLAYESRLINHHNFWKESLRRALFARCIADTLHEDPDLAFIGGLLQDFLLPMLTNRYDIHYIRFLREAAPERVNLADWERSVFGWNHAEAGALIARRWNMPDDLVAGILLHHRIDLYLQAPGRALFKLFPMAFAGLLPDQLNQTPAGVVQLIKADANSDFFRLDECCEVVDVGLHAMTDESVKLAALGPIVQQARDAMAAESANRPTS